MAKLKTFASGAPLTAADVNKYLVPEVPDGATEFDTGWVSCPLRAGVSGAAWVRRVGVITHFRAAGSLSITAGVTTPIADIPAPHRPGYVIGLPSIWSSGDFNWGNITTSGVVSVRKTTTDDRSFYLNTEWMS